MASATTSPNPSSMASAKPKGALSIAPEHHWMTENLHARMRQHWGKLFRIPWNKSLPRSQKSRRAKLKIFSQGFQSEMQPLRTAQTPRKIMVSPRFESRGSRSGKNFFVKPINVRKSFSRANPLVAEKFSPRIQRTQDAVRQRYFRSSWLECRRCFVLVAGSSGTPIRSHSWRTDHRRNEYERCTVPKLLECQDGRHWRVFSARLKATHG